MDTAVFTRILTKSRRKDADKNRLGFDSLYPKSLSYHKSTAISTPIIKKSEPFRSKLSRFAKMIDAAAS